MRSRRTGSRSIRALPPTLPPAISTCARRYVKSEKTDNRAGMDGAGRHHDHGPVGQPELFLPARETVSNGRRKQGRRSILHVELGDGENVAHDADGPFACEKGLSNESISDADPRRGRGFRAPASRSVVGADLRATRGGASGPARASRGAL